MTTISTSKFSTQQINGMGLADIQGHVATGAMPESEALSILHARIQKRVVEKRSLIPSIVDYHNQLATKLGLSQMAVPSPVYPTKPAAITVTGSSQADIDKLAGDIVAANVDIPLLINALGALLQKKGS